MDMLFTTLVPVALLAVLVSLFLGLYALFKGGDGGVRSNKMMQLRVVLQAVAIVVVLIAVWVKRH